MITLKGDNIFLRALEPQDLDFLYDIENDENVWAIGNTRTPYSKYVLRSYLKNSHKDIYEVKQLRLAICLNDGTTIGLIDLFDFDFNHRRAGIGLVIKEESNRGKGYGKEALQLLVNYCFKQLNLNQVFCNIAAENKISLGLFTSVGFKQIGIMEAWNLIGGEYKDEIMLQRLNSDAS